MGQVEPELLGGLVRNIATGQVSMVVQVAPDWISLDRGFLAPGGYIDPDWMRTAWSPDRLESQWERLP